MLLPLKPCPKYDKIYNDLLYDPAPDTDIYAFNEQNGYLYDYLSANTGLVSIYCYFAFRALLLNNCYISYEVVRRNWLKFFFNYK